MAEEQYKSRYFTGRWSLVSDRSSPADFDVDFAANFHADFCTNLSNLDYFSRNLLKSTGFDYLHEVEVQVDYQVYFVLNQ